MPLFNLKRKFTELLEEKPSQKELSVGSAESSARVVPNGELLADDDFCGLEGLPVNPESALLAAAEASFKPNTTMRTKSRLSQTLQEVLHDNSALAYFIQYMEARGAKQLIKFWLEAETFHSCALMRRQDENTVYSPCEKVKSASTNISGCNSVTVQPCVFHSNSDKGLPVSSCQVASCDLDSRSPRQLQISEDGASELERTSKTIEITNSHSVTYDVNTSVSVECSNIEGKQTVLSCEDQDPSPSRCCHNTPHPRPDAVKRERRKNSLEEDAIHIYNKYIAQDAPHPIGITHELHNQIIGKICQEGGNIASDTFIDAQNFVVETMETEYFPDFLRSNFHCKYQVDVLTSGSVYLADILYNDAALFYFMEFMEQESARHLVDFLLMTRNFHNQLLRQGAKYDGPQAQDDAMIIYEKYFSLQATTPLGFSDEIRFQVEQNICQEEGPLPDCFLKPVMILMQYIEKLYLPHFLGSQQYVKFLTECISTIQTGNDWPGRRKRSGSDSSSSEHSINIHTTNTLLAMGSKHVNPKSKGVLGKIGDQDMRIDTGLFNPDFLWQRQLAGKLQLAHVDRYGKVQTEFEPEPDRKTGSLLSKAVRKFVNKEEKAQEEMAWQIAEMIVKDVCQLTLKTDDSKNNRGSSKHEVS
ncbi:A-kinase anchoring protein pkaap isoform X1 [Tachypleus tridentatus]|uniref:A-kinase anchoring protein pkaap isoform X1 n=1 Tax=Tachypleus tridentatus TaxID=6853 RepID=UPI003FCF6A8D